MSGIEYQFSPAGGNLFSVFPSRWQTGATAVPDDEVV